MSNVTKAVVCVALVAASYRAFAQAPAEGAMPLAGLRVEDVTAGSPTEHTLLLVNLLSATPVATTLRPLSAAARRALLSSASAWTGTAPAFDAGPRFTPITASLAASSSRAAFARDGAVWQGRGLTTAATAGVTYNYRILSFALRPIAFATQNLAFQPHVGPALGPENFRYPDQVAGYLIDMPYRFGPHAYGRVDPGESWLTLDSRYLGGGFTTASQVWGPASIYPLIMGVEAAGYPRLFMEMRDVPLGIGRAAFQWSVGRLEASEFADLTPGQRSRISPAVVGHFIPAFFPGMELGFTRFVHERWERATVTRRTLLEPISGIITRPETTQSNGLASVFMRVAPPGGGVEVYGEIYRDDYAADHRDLIVEPDHTSSYVLGVRRAWRANDAIRAVTLEAANGRISHVQRLHVQPLPYVHNLIREGHTYLGQTLGSSALVGGGGVTALFEQIGRLRTDALEVSLRRTGQDLEGGSFHGKLSGWYDVRYRRTVHERWTNSWMVGLAYGFGDERGANLTVENAIHWGPSFGAVLARKDGPR